MTDDRDRDGNDFSDVFDSEESNDPQRAGRGYEPTQLFQGTETETGMERRSNGASELTRRYLMLLGQPRFGEFTRYFRHNILGWGGQAMVLLCGRRGADQFRHPLALKIFSPEPYENDAAYLKDMARMGEICNRIADIQHDNLVNLRLWTSCDEIRILEMEWIDGMDLHRLTRPDMMRKLLRSRNEGCLKRLLDTSVQAGPEQTCLKPGLAVAIIRDCLAGLAALHDARLVHNDVKPANIMVKKTGNVKLIDVGAAESLDGPVPASHLCTLRYAAPEYLESGRPVPQSDVASLGYVLVELLTGRPPFPDIRDRDELVRLKRAFPATLPSILPKDVVESPHLMRLLTMMMAADPMDRFPDAKSANLEPWSGAVAFHRELVFGNLATEYREDLQLWLEMLRASEAESSEGNGS